jgi:hypothetical protein
MMTIGEEERMYIIVPRSGSIYYRSRAGHVLDYVISQRDDSVIMWASTLLLDIITM